MIEYADMGVSKLVIGNHTEEERKQLIEEGYTFMSSGKKKYYPCEYYEIWLK